MKGRGTSNPGPVGPSRKSAGRRSRKVGTRAPTPECGFVPAEQRSDLRGGFANRTRGQSGGGGCHAVSPHGEEPDEPREVVGTAGSRQRPHVVEAEVGRDLVNPPWTSGVRGVRKLHVASRMRPPSTALATRQPAAAAATVGAGTAARRRAPRCRAGPRPARRAPRSARGRAVAASSRRACRACA